SKPSATTIAIANRNARDLPDGRLGGVGRSPNGF
ncbi:MAG: hypothetical protein RIT32_955, partial [Actinomycetota bacterium]